MKRTRLKVPWLVFAVAIINLVGCAVTESPETRSLQPDSAMKTTPYLLFDGNCREAMEFYHGIFGGELSVTTVGESPMHDGFPVAEHSKVLNARLRSSALDISASDWLEPTRRPVPGNTVRLFVVDGTMSEAGAIFDKLSRDAEILEEFRERPFGAYGVLLDRFGIRWMFHSDRIDQPGSSQGAAPGHDMRK